jgi:hypothetical protein
MMYFYDYLIHDLDRSGHPWGGKMAFLAPIHGTITANLSHSTTTSMIDMGTLGVMSLSPDVGTEFDRRFDWRALSQITFSGSHSPAVGVNLANPLLTEKSTRKKFFKRSVSETTPLVMSSSRKNCRGSFDLRSNGQSTQQTTSLLGNMPDGCNDQSQLELDSSRP